MTPRLSVKTSKEIFEKKAIPFLLKEETLNNLIIAIYDKAKNIDSTITLSVFRNGKISAAAIQTGTQYLVLATAKEDELQVIADELLKLKRDVPGVVGMTDTSETFAEIWAERSKVSSRLHQRQGIYELTQVACMRAHEGKMTIATAIDSERIVDWLHSFMAEVNSKEVRTREQTLKDVKYYIDQNRYFLWTVNGAPVSMALLTGITLNGMRIGAVWTPGEFRRHGYATQLVADLSQHVLDKGKKFVFLYTDLSNPTSNGIYQKVGYKFIGESRLYLFE